MGRLILGRPLIPGEAVGEILKSDEPLSFWGGYDQYTGEIIDRRHPLSGQCAADKLLALPASRGSSTTTAVLLEAVRNGKAPRAILTVGVDPFFSLAAVVAEEMYGQAFPVISLSEQDFAYLRSGERIRVQAEGQIDTIDS